MIKYHRWKFVLNLPIPTTVFIASIYTWGIGAAGSAFDWQSKGQGFEPPMLHQKKASFGCLFSYKSARTREGMSVVPMSCEHWNSECSDGDRNGSRGGSLQALRCRRSSPLCSTKKRHRLDAFFHINRLEPAITKSRRDILILHTPILAPHGP